MHISGAAYEYRQKCKGWISLLSTMKSTTTCETDAPNIAAEMPHCVLQRWYTGVGNIPGGVHCIKGKGMK